MRISVLTSSYPRFPGDGTAPFVKSICESLTEQGHDVQVIAPYDPALENNESNPIKIHRFRYIWPKRFHLMGHARSLDKDVQLRPSAFLLLPLFLISAFISMIKVTKQQNSQAIHVHWVIPNGVIAAWVATIRKIPFIVSLHGSDIFLATKYKLFGSIASYVFRKAAGVTACSLEQRDIAIKLCALQDPQLIPWGADPTKFNPKKRQAKIRHMFGGNQNIIVASIGRLVYKKGFDRLIKAFSAVLSANPKVRLVLGGDGPLKEELKSMTRDLGLSDYVFFTGNLAWDKVPEFLASVDIFVLPSVRDHMGNVDGLPTVLLEAMSSGVSVIASDIGGVSLVIDHNISGLLVPPGDISELTQAIVQLASNPEKRNNLAGTARKMVEVKFNWKNVAKEISSLLETISLNENQVSK
jgi:glycosyltransferase involved in cell wall biosynthesis